MKNFKDLFIIMAIAAIVSAALAVLKLQGYGFTWWQVTSPLWGLACIIVFAISLALLVVIIADKYYDKF